MATAFVPRLGGAPKASADALSCASETAKAGAGASPCLDYFAIYASFTGKRNDEAHICNVRAYTETHAVRIAKDNGLSLRERGRRIYAVRIGRDGYAKALARAGFDVPNDQGHGRLPATESNEKHNGGGRG